MSDSHSEPDTSAQTKDRRERDPDLWFRRPMHKFRNAKKAVDFKPNPEFFELADPIVDAQRTLLGYDRLYGLWQAVRNVVYVTGAAAEIGSFRGGSAYFLASALAAETGGDVPMHVFDTFAGHPEQAITDNDPFQKDGQFSDTTYDDVREYLSRFPQVQLHKGDVAASLPHVADTDYRLVHIDTDLYQPTLVCLDYFGARLARGGVIVVDDYGQKKCPGVPKAVAEYLTRSEDDWQAWDVRTEQLMLVKR